MWWPQLCLTDQPRQATLIPHLLQHPRFLYFYFSSPHKANLAWRLLHQGILYSMLTLNTCRQLPQAFLTLVWLFPLSFRLDHLSRLKVASPCFFQIQPTNVVLCPFARQLLLQSYREPRLFLHGSHDTKVDTCVWREGSCWNRSKERRSWGVEGKGKYILQS